MEDIFPVEFWQDIYYRQDAKQRYGQAVYNTALLYYPVEARRLSGSLKDPFYRDDRVPAFLEGLAELLTN